ncbi:MAG: HAD hydrolase-like protein [Nanoarchaeota archaeon]|nr:HAD hydrolase-like protein [Nanoarchaeota archaeon]
MNRQLKELVATSRCFDRTEKLEIINHLIATRESSVDSIAKTLKISPSTVYNYLIDLLRAGFVEKRKLPGKKGKFVFHIKDFTFSINPCIIANSFKIKKDVVLLIIFDMDDTIIRRSDIPSQLSQAGKNAINKAKERLFDKGIPLSTPPSELFEAKWIHSKYGNSIAWYISTWLTVAGVPTGGLMKELTDQFVNEYYTSIEHSAPACKAFPDVLPFLDALKGQAYFAATSNSSNETIIRTLKQNELFDYFTIDSIPLILGGDQIPKSKETIRALLKMAKIPAKNSVMIGDSVRDIEVARNAGIPSHLTIAVSRGITPQDTLKSLKPGVRIVNDLGKIVSFIKS